MDVWPLPAETDRSRQEGNGGMRRHSGRGPYECPRVAIFIRQAMRDAGLPIFGLTRPVAHGVGLPDGPTSLALIARHGGWCRTREQDGPVPTWAQRERPAPTRLLAVDQHDQGGILPVSLPLPLGCTCRYHRRMIHCMGVSARAPPGWSHIRMRGGKRDRPIMKGILP